MSSRVSKKENGRVIVNTNPNSVISEAFRTLRTNLILSNVDTGVSSLVITSADRGEGKSTVSANLAAVLAQTEKEVLLIDCDLRLPTQDKIFNVPKDLGVTSLVGNGAEVGEYSLYIHEVQPRLSVLTSGPLPPNPSEFLGSHSFRSFLKKAEQLYDSVILDAPPVGLVTDAAVLSTLVGGVVLVLDSQSGHRNLAMRAKSALDQVNANLLGIVLNNIKQERGSYYAYYSQEEGSSGKA